MSVLVSVLQVCELVFTVAAASGLVVSLAILVDGLRNYRAVRRDGNLRLTAQLWIGAGAMAALAQAKLVVLGALIIGAPIRVSWTTEIVLPLYAASATAVLVIALWVLRHRFTLRAIVLARLRLLAAQEASAAVILDSVTLHILVWSDEARALFGWAAVDVLDRPMSAWFVPVAWVAADDWMLVRKSATDPLTSTTLAVAKMKDGTEISVSLSIIPDRMATRDVLVGYFRLRSLAGPGDVSV